MSLVHISVFFVCVSYSGNYKQKYKQNITFIIFLFIKIILWY